MADRFAWGLIKENALDRRVAKAPWYYGDGATLLLLLGVLVVTGMTMTLTYSPHPDSAYQSVEYITGEQTLGWFIRAMHYWAAGFMVIMLVWHVLRLLLVGGHKFPREGTWLIGVVLFWAVIVMSFTGYVLRWDQRAIHALDVSLHIFSRVPLLGEWLVYFVQGDSQTGAIALTRIYAVHVVFVPALLLLGVAWHLYLVIVHGITSKEERRKLVRTAEEQKELYQQQANSDELGETFYPETAVHSGAFAMVVFGIVLALTIFAGPAPLMSEADRVTTSFPAEEWWWWWLSSLIALLPSWIAPWFVVVFPVLLLVAMVALPLIDRGPKRGMRRRPLVVAFVVVVVLTLIGLSGLRLRSPWTGWPLDQPPPVPAGLEISSAAEYGRQLFNERGCNSCHAVAGHGRQVAVDLATLSPPRSREELLRYIANPPEGVAMPAYQRRATELELEALAEFVLVAQTFRTWSR
jgi:ubiquinol-cytochrome c reductase cytochrome b subunit